MSYLLREKYRKIKSCHSKGGTKFYKMISVPVLLLLKVTLDDHELSYLTN